ncbi:hypothetical protein C8J57DRAFT_1736552 [Mycena rebaudengoi]|nr:hypothetical protein C8J57DRAFT_1736552 [Mycena rebaudengoi]
MVDVVLVNADAESFGLKVVGTRGRRADKRTDDTLLCVDTEGLFSGPPDFGHSLFSSITHLKLLDDDISAYSDESWMGLASLPSLTHLAFEYFSIVPARLLHMLLEEREILQVLILIVANKEFLNDTDNPVSALPTHDVRLFRRLDPRGVGEGGCLGSRRQLHSPETARQGSQRRVFRRRG